MPRRQRVTVRPLPAAAIARAGKKELALQRKAERAAAATILREQFAAGLPMGSINLGAESVSLPPPSIAALGAAPAPPAGRRQPSEKAKAALANYRDRLARGKVRTAPLLFFSTDVRTHICLQDIPTQNAASVVAAVRAAIPENVVKRVRKRGDTARARSSGGAQGWAAKETCMDKFFHNQALANLAWLARNMPDPLERGRLIAQRQMMLADARSKGLLNAHCPRMENRKTHEDGNLISYNPPKPLYPVRV